MSKKLVTVLMVALLIMSSLLGCAQSKPAETASGSASTQSADKPAADAPASDSIKLAFVNPLTGTMADVGNLMKDAVELRVKELNADGGINGRTVEVEYYDDKCDPKEAATVAAKIISDDSICAVIGNYSSSCVLAAATLYEEAGIPMIHYGTSGELRTKHGETLFGIAVPLDLQSDFICSWMFEQGYSKPALIYTLTDYGESIRKGFTACVAVKGASIVKEESFVQGSTTDFMSILTNIKATGADCVMLAAEYNEAALIVKQARDLGLEIGIFDNEGMYEPAFLELAGDAANKNCYCCGVFLPTDPSPLVQTFVTDYQAAYGEVPGAFAALAYDTMDMFAKVIEKVGADRAAICGYLNAMPEDYTGITGTFSFDVDDHFASRASLVRLTVKDGQFAVVE